MGPQEQSFQRVGRYDLIRKIATGGMAELFLARFTGPGGFEKRCALKRILPQFAQDEEFTRMFLNEARVAAMFDHPNLVQIFELGTDDATGQFYIAMELINGMDLRQLVNMGHERGQQVPPEIATYVVAQAVDGLAYAHEFRDIEGHALNLIHRDVSPQNILVSYEGAVKVVDFGIVKTTTNRGETLSGQLKGKIAYMSPEQAVGEKVDARADIFAAGAVLYELITGVKPFRGANEIMTLKAILETEPAPINSIVPDCPGGIERAVLKCLAKRREDRFQTARELQAELLSVLKLCPTAIDRHVLAEFVRSMTENSGTERFDPSKLKIPIPASGPRFAISQFDSSPGERTSGPPLPVNMPVMSAGNGGGGAALNGTAPMTEAAINMTNPGVAGADRDFAGADTPDFRPTIARKAPMLGLAAGLVALLLGAAWWMQQPGDAVVIETNPLPEPAVAAKLDPAPKDPTKAPPPAGTTGPAAATGASGATGATGAAAVAPVAPKNDTRSPDAERPRRGKRDRAAAAAAAAEREREREREREKSGAEEGGGKLSLKSIPSGLVVKLGAKTLGKTPLAGVPLPPGKHSLQLSNGSLGIQKTISVEINKDGTTSEAITIGKGTVKVNSRPWAEVFIDGRSVGKTPLQRPVYEGKHEIKLVSPEAGERIQMIDVEAGEDKDLRIKF